MSCETTPTTPGSGRTKSVFDIFREDITSDVTAAAEENKFLEVVMETTDHGQGQRSPVHIVLCSVLPRVAKTTSSSCCSSILTCLWNRLETIPS